MIKMKQLVCPISTEKINEKVTRLNALITILIVVSGIVFNTLYPMVFLLADFYIRAFTKLRFSPISFASRSMVNALNLGVKKTDKAPKIFAARIGFLFTLAIIILFLFELTTALYIVAGVLVFFATLEFALAICMGCILYTYAILPFFKR
jgi:hypothetical protein